MTEKGGTRVRPTNTVPRLRPFTSRAANGAIQAARPATFSEKLQICCKTVSCGPKGRHMGFIDQPIINSPFAMPNVHYELDAEGQPTGVRLDGRRRSIQIVPVPAARRRGPQQAELDLFEEEVTENHLINEIRTHVDQWRALPPNCNAMRTSPPFTGWVVRPELAARNQSESRNFDPRIEAEARRLAAR
jgi:hypothetical protein